MRSDIPKILLSSSGTNFLRTLWERDRDPYLRHVRWRLHLRLLLLAACGAAAFAAVPAGMAGPKLLYLPVVASLCAWLVLSRSPAGNGVAVRANIALFAGVGIW